jgi:SAM-dependent methyltransferase
MKTGILVVLSLLLATSCRKQPAPPKTEPPKPAEPAPIECPLAKQGKMPDHLRPFEDVEKYIAFLERPERDSWQHPDLVVSALGLDGKETVADLGAGSGYFSFRFAAALPEGKVVSSDVEPEMVRHMHHKAMTAGMRNLQVVLGKADEPGLPPGTDLVFMCDVLHHVPDRNAWLGKLVAQMPSGARLALIEFREGKLPEGPPEHMKIPRGELIDSLTRAGLRLETEMSKLLPYQYFLVFRKP